MPDWHGAAPVAFQLLSTGVFSTEIRQLGADTAAQLVAVSFLP